MSRRLALAACTLVLAAPALAFDMPPRKPGLWEMKMTLASRGNMSQTIQHCVDAATDKLLNSNFGAMAKENCPKQDVTKTATGMIVDSVCTIGNRHTTSHAVFNGDFDKAYTVNVTTTVAGGEAKPGTSAGQVNTMTIEARWAGACKPGQKPGDMIMPGGQKVNVLEMLPAMQRR